MDMVTSQCDLGITNGSSSTTAQFLLAGKPVLMMPLHVEQLLSSRAIAAAGYGITVNYLQKQTFSYADAIRELTSQDNSYKLAAENFSLQHQGYKTNQPTEHMLDDIKRLLQI